MGRLNRRIPNELRKRTAQSCDLCKAVSLDFTTCTSQVLAS